MVTIDPKWVTSDYISYVVNSLRLGGLHTSICYSPSRFKSRTSHIYVTIMIITLSCLGSRQNVFTFVYLSAMLLNASSITEFECNEAMQSNAAFSHSADWPTITKNIRPSYSLSLYQLKQSCRYIYIVYVYEYFFVIFLRYLRQNSLTIM